MKVAAFKVRKIFGGLFFKMFLDRNHEKRQSPFPLPALPLTGVWVGGVES